MGKRYVPRTYNNHHILRIILGAIVSFALAVVIIFLLLFFVLRDYYAVFLPDGTVKIELPWLVETPDD